MRSWNFLLLVAIICLQKRAIPLYYGDTFENQQTSDIIVDVSMVQFATRHLVYHIIVVCRHLHEFGFENFCHQIIANLPYNANEIARFLRRLEKYGNWPF